MKKFLAAALLAALVLPATAAAADAPAKVKAAIERVKKIAADPAIVAAVKTQNGKKLPLSEIQKIDKEWIAGDTKISSEIAARPCSQKLQKLLATDKDLIEAFAMDDQGANVCMTGRTSDYWQGDEPKWQKSFNDGKGAAFIDERKFDSSAQAVIVQVSVPVMDQGKAIGALTVGVKADDRK